MKLYSRLQFTFIVACLSAIFAYSMSEVRSREYHADVSYDYSFYAVAGRMLNRGMNPYTLPLFPDKRSTNHDVLFYPLPSVLTVLAISELPLPYGIGIFIGISSALLAYAIYPYRIRWYMLFSIPYIICCINGQWSIFISAIYLLPALAFMWIVKPTIALPTLLSLPKSYIIRGVLGGGVLCIISLWWLPSWPVEWLSNLRYTHHSIPVLYAPISLLSILYWHNPRARVLLLMSLIPQHYWYYDMLPLFLLPSTHRGMIALLITSWLAFFLNEITLHQYVVAIPLAMLYTISTVILVCESHLLSYRKVLQWMS